LYAHFNELTTHILYSALKDHRFEPITLSELPQLRCTVSLLHSFEPGASWEDWEIGTHGITIEFTDPQTYTQRSATFLPEIAAHEKWSKTTTLEHLVRKSGCTAGAGAVLEKINLTRYQSVACTLSYEEYLQLKEPRLFRREKGRERRSEDAITVPA
jgi:AMMECR1 domain-containing protein